GVSRRRAASAWRSRPRRGANRVVGPFGHVQCGTHTVPSMQRLARMIWGTDFDPAVRPLLVAAFFGAVGGSCVWTYTGIWAIKHLGATQAQLSVGFLIGAFVSIASGWLGGHLSDHIGRRSVMLTAWAGQTIVPLALLAVGHHVLVGLAVMV